MPEWGTWPIYLIFFFYFHLISLPPAVFETKNASHLNVPWFYAQFTWGIAVSMSEAWCWHDHHSDNITFLVLPEWDWLASVLGYMHKAIWLADAFGAWKVFNFCHKQRKVKRCDGPTIQFGVNGALQVFQSTHRLLDYENMKICTSLNEYTLSNHRSVTL